MSMSCASLCSCNLYRCNRFNCNKPLKLHLATILRRNELSYTCNKPNYSTLNHSWYFKNSNILKIERVELFYPIVEDSVLFLASAAEEGLTTVAWRIQCSTSCVLSMRWMPLRLLLLLGSEWADFLSLLLLIWPRLGELLSIGRMASCSYGVE